jgi:hypothetical protein
MDWDEMSNLYRGPPIDAFYQVLVHFWQSSFRGEDFLEIDQSFCSDPLTNMATTGNSCFWLVDF